MITSLTVTGEIFKISLPNNNPHTTHSIYREPVYIDFTQPKHLVRFQLDVDTGCSFCGDPYETVLDILGDLKGATCTTTPLQITQLTIK